MFEHYRHNQMLGYPDADMQWVLKECIFYCFPLLCYTFGKEEQITLDIFTEPFIVMKDLFQRIQIKNPIQFAGLTICAIITELHENLFDSFQTDDGLSDDKKTMDKVLNGIGLTPPVCYSGLKDQLELSCGVYVNKCNGIYEFIHTLFKEVTLFITGKNSKGFIF